MESINRDVSSNPYLGKSPEELSAIKKDLETKLAVQRKQQLMNTISEGASGVGDIFLQRGGLKSPARTKPERSTTDEINEFIAKERLKQQIASEAPLSPSEEEAKLRLEAIKKRTSGQVNTQPDISPSSDVISQESSTSFMTPAASASASEEPPMYINIPTGEYDSYTGEQKTKQEVNPRWTEYNKQKAEMNKGLPAESAGKSGMLEQATQDLMEAEPILFPGEGKDEKFARGRAWAANLPMSRLPVLGRIIPNALPFVSNAKKLNSLMTNALEAKLRIETGAAATPEEFNRLMERFGIAVDDTYVSAKDKWTRLLDFMQNTTIKIDPSGKYQYYNKAKSNNQGNASSSGQSNTEYQRYLKEIGQ